jgi:hypothetical protein
MYAKREVRKEVPLQSLGCNGLKESQELRRRRNVKHKTRVYAVMLIDQLLTMDERVGEAPMPYVRPHENHGEHGKKDMVKKTRTIPMDRDTPYTVPMRLLYRHKCCSN